jgi:hypothetical protein
MQLSGSFKFSYNFSAISSGLCVIGSCSQLKIAVLDRENYNLIVTEKEADYCAQ